jgi:hypothetical protein
MKTLLYLTFMLIAIVIRPVVTNITHSSLIGWIALVAVILISVVVTNIILGDKKE